MIAAIGAIATGLGWAARRIYIDLVNDRDWYRDALWKALGMTVRSVDVSAELARREGDKSDGA